MKEAEDKKISVKYNFIFIDKGRAEEKPPIRNRIEDVLLAILQS